MRQTLAMILAGGVGSRLNLLVRHRAKPAVPFGGMYRIIDFALSNAMNSGIVHAAVLTQYKPLSLMRHIGTGAPWDFVGRTRTLKILPPRTGEKDSDWYRGTADAVRQNLDFIGAHPSRQLLILSGDHVYHMDYGRMVEHHRSTGAKVTVAMMEVPWEETHQFGIGITDERGRIVEWEEKPAKARSNLASMGIYVFDTDYLIEALTSTTEVDFGHHIIPMAMEEGVLFAYPFRGYWRDVGTVRSYWEAHMEYVTPGSPVDPEAWGICTNLEEEGMVSDRPPARIMPGATVRQARLSPGCRVAGRVERSVLSPGVVVEAGAQVTDSVLLHDCLVEAGARVHRTICDKKVIIGAGASVGLGDPSVPNAACPSHLSSGLTLLGMGALVPSGARVGTNCIVAPDVEEGHWPSSKLLEDGATLEP